MLIKFFVSTALSLSVTAALATDVTKIIVTAGAGTPVDHVARSVAASEALQKELGQVPIVLNKMGASGAIPVTEVAVGKKDGKTWLVSNATTFGTLPVLNPDVKYDPLKNFEQVNIMAATPRALIVHKDFPANDFNEFVKVLQGSPNKYNFGGIPLSTNHLDMQSLSKSLKFDYEWIGYQSSSHVIPDLLSGRIHGAIIQIAALLPYIKSGQLKVLAVTWDRRLPDFPNTPTWAELGYPMLNIPSWYGIAVPKGTSPEIVQRINRAVTLALNEPEVQARLASGYNFPLNIGPDRATRFVQEGVRSARKQADQVGMIK